MIQAHYPTNLTAPQTLNVVVCTHPTVSGVGYRLAFVPRQTRVGSFVKTNETRD